MLAKKLKAAGVDRSPRGWDKTSDHASIWKVETEAVDLSAARWPLPGPINE
jgi:hypothetical protein